MSDPAVDQALAESTQEVLEKMFFIDLSSESTAMESSQPIAVELIFDGEPPGSFRLLLDCIAARSAAADFLGVDSFDLNPEQQNEVVCELANMICGSALSRIESNATFRLGKPSVIDAEAVPRWTPTAVFEASVRGGVLRAELVMERLVCPDSELAS